jgi:hypothetical protein
MNNLRRITLLVMLALSAPTPLAVFSSSSSIG